MEIIKYYLPLLNQLLNNQYTIAIPSRQGCFLLSVYIDISKQFAFSAMYFSKHVQTECMEEDVAI